MHQGRVVIIANGDDVGGSPSFTDATLDAYAKGHITSASILVPGSDADRAMSFLKQHPHLPIGIHLTLNGDWPPLTAGKSLRGPSGTMWSTEREVGQNVDPAEASVEWEAQIGKVLDAGIAISHLDSHMGCYFQTPLLFRAAYALAVRHGLPLIAASPAGQMLGTERRFLPLSSYSGIYRLSGVEETVENRAAAYSAMLGKLQPGIHYLYTHHACRPSDGRITGDLDLRINDHAFWSSPDTRKRMAEEGYVMMGCAPLKVEFRKELAFSDSTPRG